MAGKRDTRGKRPDIKQLKQQAVDLERLIAEAGRVRAEVQERLNRLDDAERIAAIPERRKRVRPK